MYEVENISLDGKTYYKIRLSSDTIIGSFKPITRTHITDYVAAGSSVVSVDSTVGFAKSSSFYVGRQKFNLHR